VEIAPQIPASFRTAPQWGKGKYLLTKRRGEAGTILSISGCLGERDKKSHPMKILVVATAIIVLAAVAHPAIAQTGNEPFCLQSPSGARCVYTTMGACESARGDAPFTQCITRADAHGATGLGEPTIPSPRVPTR
jgi:hypothetical protein